MIRYGIMALCLLTVCVAAPAHTIVRASVNASGQQANAFSYTCDVSATGRYVVIGSYATNLVPGDTNGYSDAFVWDRDTGAVQSASVTSTGGQPGNDSAWPTISDDGNRVAYSCYANNMVPGYIFTMFVRDLQAATTTPLDADPDGNSCNGLGSSAAISGDGRYVAYRSAATNLVPDDTNGVPDTFRHDLQTGETIRVSVDGDGVQANAESVDPSISADGRFVAFSSSATNLVAGDTNGVADVFVHDVVEGTTTRVSVDASGVQGNGASSRPSLSACGRYVAFHSDASNLVAGDTNGFRDVFVKDLQTGTVTLASVAANGGPVTGPSYEPTISADGTRVAFSTSASNLVAGDTNGCSDVFVRDLAVRETVRVSVSATGEQGGASSYGAKISADGKYVGFRSGAGNLVPDDTNGCDDIFLAGISMPPRPDALISNGTTYLGDGVYNTDGTGQTFSQHVAPRRIGVYQIRCENDGDEEDSLKITGTAGGPSSGYWRVRYYSGSDGADITDEVTGAGWSTPTLAKGEHVTLTAEIIPPAGAAEDSEQTLLVTATSTDGVRSDTVKAVAVCRLIRGVDGLIHNGSTFIGGGVVNADGTGQTHNRDAHAGTAAGYEMVFQNDGNSWDSLKVTGTAGDANWSVQYVEYWSGTDITAQVTGAGWQSPSVGPGGGCRLRLYVAPSANAAPGSTFPASIMATSVGDGTTADTVKAVTTCAPLYRPDGQIHNGTTYIGDDIYNTRGTDQTHTRAVAEGTAATCYVACQNDGNVPDSLRITGTPGNGSWSVQYQDWSGADITADVTGAGWVRGPFAAGGSVRLRVVVTPLAGTLGGSSLSVYVTGTSVTNAAARDTVRATTTCVPAHRPDAQIHDGSGYLGDDIYNTTGAGQTHSRTTPSGVAAGYYVAVQNDGNGTDRFAVTGTAGTASWNVQYLEASSGVNVTAQVTGAGWQTPVLGRGGCVRLVVNVTPGANAYGGTPFPVLVTATSVGDATKKDTVRAATTCSPVYRPDGHIHDGSAFLGDGIYNTTGAGQTATLWGLPGATVTHHVRLENDGNAPQSLTVTGTGGTTHWEVRYLEHSSATDITAAVTGAGWTSPSLNPGASCRVRVQVRSLAGVAGGASLTTTIRAASSGGAPGVDVVRAVTGCRVVSQPDGTIYDGTAYVGDDIYNTTGAGQTSSATVAAGATATFHVRMQNDGNTAESLVLTGLGGNAKWAVRYFDHQSGADITAAVTGAGWTTPAIASGGSLRLRVAITPGPTTSAGETTAATLTATSSVDASRKDTVRAQATRR